MCSLKWTSKMFILLPSRTINAHESCSTNRVEQVKDKSAIINYQSRVSARIGVSCPPPAVKQWSEDPTHICIEKGRNRYPLIYTTFVAQGTASAIVRISTMTVRSGWLSETTILDLKLIIGYLEEFRIWKDSGLGPFRATSWLF